MVDFIGFVRDNCPTIPEAFALKDLVGGVERPLSELRTTGWRITEFRFARIQCASSRDCYSMRIKQADSV